MEDIQGQIKSIHKLAAELTHYLCEDESKIKLEDILNTFKTFCVNLNKAVEVSSVTSLYSIVHTMAVGDLSMDLT